MKEKIRPIYSELQGYLSQAPDRDGGYIFEASIWKQHNQTIDELNNISGKNYDRYKVEVKNINWNRSPSLVIDSQSYRIKLGGLISRLHGEYFSDESPPFSGMPSTIINTTQTQNQSISIFLDIQEKILSEIPKHAEGSKERTFLEKVKSALPNMKTITDILSNVLKIGTELGLQASDISKLLRL